MFQNRANAGLEFKLRGPIRLKYNVSIYFRGRGMDNKLVLIIIALLLPPLAVFMKSGAGKDLVINILLCFVFWVPAIVHSLWVVAQ